MSTHKYPVGSAVQAEFSGKKLQAVVVECLPEVYKHKEGPLYSIQFAENESVFHYRESQLSSSIPDIELGDIVEAWTYRHGGRASFPAKVITIHLRSSNEVYGAFGESSKPAIRTFEVECVGCGQRIDGDVLETDLKLLRKGSEDATWG